MSKNSVYSNSASGLARFKSQFDPLFEQFQNQLLSDHESIRLQQYPALARLLQEIPAIEPGLPVKEQMEILEEIIDKTVFLDKIPFAYTSKISGYGLELENDRQKTESSLESLRLIALERMTAIARQSSQPLYWRLCHQLAKTIHTYSRQNTAAQSWFEGNTGGWNSFMEQIGQHYRQSLKIIAILCAMQDNTPPCLSLAQEIRTLSLQRDALIQKRNQRERISQIGSLKEQIKELQKQMDLPYSQKEPLRRKINKQERKIQQLEHEDFQLRMIQSELEQTEDKLKRTSGKLVSAYMKGRDWLEYMNYDSEQFVFWLPFNDLEQF